MMKKCIRFMAVVLCFLLIVQTLPVSSATIESLTTETVTLQTTAEENAGIAQEPTAEEPYILAEDISKRTENVKHFKMSDGSYQAAVYASPIHYTENGEWKEIDNTIKLNTSSKTAANKYSAKVSDVEFSFPDAISSDGRIRIKKNGHEISFGYMKNNSSFFSSSEIIEASETQSARISSDAIKKDIKYNINNGALKYNNVSISTDIEYELNSTMLKESIVVSSKQSEYIYRFKMDTGSLLPVTNEDGSISLFDKNSTDCPEYVIAAPFMTDARGIFSDSVIMSLEASGEEYVLTVTADKEWLNADDREFPVIIDPTLIYEPDRINDIFDTYVDSASPSTNHYLSTYSIIGHNSLGTGRAYLKFNLPTLPHCGVIVNATLLLIQMGYDPGNGVTNHIAVYESPSAQDYQTLTWNNQPSLSSQPIVDYTVFQSGSNGSVHYTLDITKIAKNWFETGTNNGLFLASANESSSWRSTIYTSNYTGYSVYPMIKISYIDNKGLEDYWSYETIDMGRSGTAYINEYNGLLTYVHQDISLGGNITYLSAAHIYSNDYGNDSKPYGYGFRLTAQESITALSEDNALYNSMLEYRAYLTDADGTAHYFREKENNVWYYEFDDKLILTKSTTGFVLQYEDGSRKNYDASGKLTSITDRNGHTINQSYDTSGRVSAITDALGRTFRYTYNTDGYLSSTKDAADRITTYTYNNGYLRTITYPDGKTTQLSYLSGKMFSIRATDTTSAAFLYHSNNRIDFVTLKGTDNTTILKNIYFYYKGPNTVIEDSHGRELTVGFDNMGRAVSFMDKDGNISTTKYHSTGNLNNKIYQSSDTFSFSDNKLKNHSFEDDFNNWALHTDGGTHQQSISASYHYIGNGSLKLTRSSAGDIAACQDINDIVAGKEYTLSAYVRAIQMNGGSAFLRIEGKKSTATVSAINSSFISAVTDGWVRLQVTYSLPSEAEYIRVCLYLTGTSGTVYFDAVQFEEASSAGHYNLLTNPGFESYSSNTFTGWNSHANAYSVSGGINNTKAAAINGSITEEIRLVQQVYVGTSNVERTLIFGGTSKGECAAKSNAGGGPRFCLVLEMFSDSGLIKSAVADYNAFATDTAQLVFNSATIDSTITEIRLHILYDCNVNTAYFDNFFIYIDNYGTKYEYDSETDRLVKQSNNAGDAISYKYIGPDIEKITVTKNGEEKDSCEYTYDSNHNILTEKTKDGIITTYSYASSSGMPSNVTVTSADGTLQSSVSYTYMLFDNYTRRITDARGNTESFFYNSNKDLLTSYTDANGTVTNYEYDSNNDELKRVYTTVGSETVDVNYSTDTNGRLSTITQGGVSYSFTYDVFGRRTATKFASQTLASYSYNSKGLLGSTTYGNGTVHSLTYDEADRIISEAYDGTTAYSYSYNTEGYLGKTVDHGLGVTTYYGYDLVGRVTDVDSSDGVSSDFLYNEYNSIAGYTVKKNNSVISSAGYSYSENGLLTAVATNNSSYNSFSYTYDALNRLYLTTHPVSGSSINTIYLYTAGTNSETTGLISMIGYMNGNSQLMPSLSYTYDNNGNINTIAKNGTTHITYTYDSLNRLIREDNKDLNQSVTYTYDVRGNILSKNTYAYTTGTLGTATDTINYTYSNSWKDKLYTYDGQSISYDSIGNPTSYRGATLTWQKGRQLASYTTSSKTLNFKYNIDGLRTQKKVGSTTYSYIWSSGLLMQQSDGTNTLKFSYSPDGRPLGVVFNGTNYYYIYNLQGDVIGLYNNTGTVVVEYTYDSWGKLISTTGSLASTLGKLNPFRYRGYIYDEETGLYYVSSRYYDPEIGRWINADNRISGVGGDVLGYNMFAYCMNNPVNMSDPSGGWPKWLETAVKVASVVVAVTAVVVMVATVSAVSAGTAAPGALLGASVFLGAALSGINGGVANEAKGNSYINGYLGGATGGAIQGVCSKTPAGTIVGGGAGVTVGTAVTDVMNNLDPDSANSTAKEIASNAITSGGKALVTSSLTASMGYASDLAAINGANGLMPTYTRGFGEAVKAFFGWLDDALVYIWE